jgi:flagellin
LSVATQAEARSTLDLVETYRAELLQTRSNIGAGMSRLAVAAATLAVTTETYAAAESRIRDVDVAEESSRLINARILQQTGAAVLAQANQQPALALRLLG